MRDPAPRSTFMLLAEITLNNAAVPIGKEAMRDVKIP